jgi:hypothetical protein
MIAFCNDWPLSIDYPCQLKDLDWGGDKARNTPRRKIWREELGNNCQRNTKPNEPTMQHLLVRNLGFKDEKSALD